MDTEQGQTEQPQGEQPEQPQPQRVRVRVDILKPETCPKGLKDFYNQAQREALAAALAEGHIKVEDKDVTVKDKSKDKSGVDEKWPYVAYIAQDAAGMAALAGGRNTVAKPLPENYDKLSENDKRKADNAARDGAADYFNYGFGLTITQPIRTMLTNSLGGVEKEIEKQIAQTMKTGIYDTEDEAREAVIAQRRKKGLEVPE